MECPYCNTTLEEHEATECFDAWVVEAVLGWERIEFENRPEKYLYLVGPYLRTVSETPMGAQCSPSTDLVDAYPVWVQLSDQAKADLIDDGQTHDMLAVCKKALEESHE
jgi:hypothetical protein